MSSNPTKEATNDELTVDLNASIDSNASNISNASNASRGKFELPELTLESCSSFERKFVVASDHVNSMKFYKLRHPKENRYALYHIDENTIAEVLQIDGERSCFYGNSVVKDSKITILSPIHPFFLLMPYIQEKPFTVEELTTSIEYPAIKLLANIPSVIKALKLTCDSTIQDQYIRFVRNEEKLNNWLEKRFDLLVNALKSYDGIPQAVRSSEDSLRYHAFDIFSDYVSDEISTVLKFKWYIQKPLSRPTSENITTVKRPMVPQATAKKPKDSNAKKLKSLKEASKGIPKLTSFFQQ